MPSRRARRGAGPARFGDRFVVRLRAPRDGLRSGAVARRSAKAWLEELHRSSAVALQAVIQLQPRYAQRAVPFALGAQRVDEVDLEPVAAAAIDVVDDAIERVRAPARRHEPVHVVALIGDRRTIAGAEGAIDQMLRDHVAVPVWNDGPAAPESEDLGREGLSRKEPRRLVAGAAIQKRQPCRERIAIDG